MSVPYLAAPAARLSCDSVSHGRIRAAAASECSRASTAAGERPSRAWGTSLIRTWSSPTVAPCAMDVFCSANRPADGWSIATTIIPCRNERVTAASPFGDGALWWTSSGLPEAGGAEPPDPWPLVVKTPPSTTAPAASAARPRRTTPGRPRTRRFNIYANPAVDRAASLSSRYSPAGGTVSTVLTVDRPAGVARSLPSMPHTAQRRLDAVSCLAPSRSELCGNLRPVPVLVVSDHLDELLKVLTGKLRAFSPVGLLRRRRSRRNTPCVAFRGMPIAAQPTKAVQRIAQ